MGQYGKSKYNTDIFRIGPIPVSPETARSESARRFDNRKEKSREILDRLMVLLRDVFHIGLVIGHYEKHHVIILYCPKVKKQETQTMADKALHRKL